MDYCALNEKLFDGTGRADSAAKAGRLNALDVSSNVFIMKKEVNNWIAGADYDLGTAEHLLKAAVTSTRSSCVSFALRSC